jgi:hypothetical protein
LCSFLYILSHTHVITSSFGHHREKKTGVFETHVSPKSVLT